MASSYEIVLCCDRIGLLYYIVAGYGVMYSSGQNKVPTAEWKSRLIVAQ